MESIKQALKSKTIKFGLLLSLASTVQLFIPYLPQEYIAPAGQAIAAVVIWLRFKTTEAVSEK